MTSSEIALALENVTRQRDVLAAQLEACKRELAIAKNELRNALDNDRPLGATNGLGYFGRADR